ncbi:MAG TPA: addiction module protein [Oligoflexia bacterium]|nr:addiction module protein [Oligoflexia bacterium]HMP48981.1 addiction module protein [Oligoflexia bacterium]
MRSIDQTISSLSGMTVIDRLRLAEAIWDSLDDSNVAGLTAEQRSELDRRLTEHDCNPGSAISREEVEKRVAKLR